MNSRRISARAASLSAALVLVGATAAAAATGSLPEVAQSTVANALSHVSVDVPNPDLHRSDDASDHVSGRQADQPVGPDAGGSAKQGLCTAWAARNRTDADRGESANSTAFSNLRHAARADGQLVKEYCAAVLAGRDDHGQSGGDKSRGADGAHNEHPAAGDSGQSGQEHGRQGDDQLAPVATPNAGGIGTGSSASDDANTTGVDRAAPEAKAGADNASPNASHGSAGRP